MSLSVGQHEGPTGGEIQVPVVVTGSPGMGAGHVELVFDAKVLEVASVSPGAMLEGKALFESNTHTSGRLVMGFASSGGVEGDGPLAVVTFKVLGETDAGSPLALEAVEAWRADNDLDILITTADGGFKVVGVDLKWVLFGLLGALLVLLILFFRVLSKARRR